MKTGKILHQELKIGGKIREIRAGAVTVSKETKGKDLLTPRQEKKIVRGGWKSEIEPLSPEHPEAECSEICAEGAPGIADDDGKSPGITLMSVSIPKVSVRNTRIDMRIPRIGQKASIHRKIQTATPQLVAMPQPEEAVPEVGEESQAKAVKAPKIVAEPRPELFPVPRKAKVKTIKSAELSARPESAIPETEPEPVEQEVAETAADLRFQVVPTPRKRRPKSPEPEVEPAITQTPRPIKVIRRRAEEAPKVFETAPKVLPKAMLEGVKLLVEEEGDNPIE